MPPLQLAVPQVLGHYFSFASIEARLGIQSFVDFTAINYTSSLDVADVYGSKPQKLGTTRGKQNAEATIEMYLRAWEVFRQSLAGGVGYGEVPFPVTVQYAELLQPVITDMLVGCRVVKVDRQNAEGTDPLKVTLTLNVLRILEGITGGGGGMIAAPLGIF